MSSFRQRHLPVLLLFLLACSATGGEKPSCAVLSLDALAGANKEEAALLSDRLTTEVWNTDKYVIIARQKVKDIPAVQAINQSNTWSATDVAVEIGRAISVKYVICGSLGHIDSLYTINVYNQHVAGRHRDRAGREDDDNRPSWRIRIVADKCN